ncbi:hypothetical protein E2C01_058750 [Portunus trituberculatus]|uniref:Uncharacterized protein n=1 Tax=Portunus trituberculatus TaxID=210409 RepID=A0A5B7H0P2_PORTR|nr:hypothetical protein [Portunus trituberculatus]
MLGWGTLGQPAPCTPQPQHKQQGIVTLYRQVVVAAAGRAAAARRQASGTRFSSSSSLAVSQLEPIKAARDALRRPGLGTHTPDHFASLFSPQLETLHWATKMFSIQNAYESIVIAELHAGSSSECVGTFREGSEQSSGLAGDGGKRHAATGEPLPPPRRRPCLSTAAARQQCRHGTNRRHHPPPPRSEKQEPRPLLSCKKNLLCLEP